MSKRADFIRRWEGYSPVVYLDSAGLPTIGIGHLLTKAEALKYKNTVLSAIQIEVLLNHDLRKVDDAISRLVRVNLNENEFTALSSFIFNIGVGAFGRSTLRMRLNRSDKEGAADQFLRWNKSGGRVVKGLVNRRRAERLLFLS